MGYGLHYKLENPQNAEDANDFVHQQQEYRMLSSCGYDIHFWSTLDEKDSEKTNHMNYDVGEGYNNLNVALAHNAEQVINPWSRLFAEIHAETPFSVKFLSNSCALTADGYFEGTNLKELTDNGNALTGDKKQEVRQKIPEE